MHSTLLQTSNDAQAVQRNAHLPGTKVEIKFEIKEEIEKIFRLWQKKLQKKQLTADNFLVELRKSMQTKSEDHSRL